MENCKEVQSNSTFLFEYYERLISFSDSQTNEANGSVLDIPIGFIGHANLYKCLSWRPYKMQIHELKKKRLEYIEFIRALTNVGYIVIQICEFAINWSTQSTMAWMRQNDSSYILKETQNFRFSCIAAVSFQSCELLKISQFNNK